MYLLDVGLVLLYFIAYSLFGDFQTQTLKTKLRRSKPSTYLRTLQQLR